MAMDGLQPSLRSSCSLQFGNQRFWMIIFADMLMNIGVPMLVVTGS